MKVLMHEHLLCDIAPPKLALKQGPEPEITLKTLFAINYGRVPHVDKFRLDRLDSASLTAQRRLTVPFVRDTLKASEDFEH